MGLKLFQKTSIFQQIYKMFYLRKIQDIHFFYGRSKIVTWKALYHVCQNFLTIVCKPLPRLLVLKQLLKIDS